MLEIITLGAACVAATVGAVFLSAAFYAAWKVDSPVGK